MNTTTGMQCPTTHATGQACAGCAQCAAPAAHPVADADINFLMSTMDARLWADEFCKRNPAADHGTMLAWFACAIMTGFDEANRRAVPRPAAGTETLGSEAAGLTLAQIAAVAGSCMNTGNYHLFMAKVARVLAVPVEPTTDEKGGAA